MPNTKNRKTKYSKRIIAIIIMVLLVFTSVFFMQRFMCIPNSFDENRNLFLHKEPSDSIDVLLIGSSATYSGFSSAYAYEQFGFTSYPYAIGGSTCTIWKPALQDAQRTQSPKLIVVDVFGGGYEHDLIASRNNQVYTIMAHMPVCKTKLELAKELNASINQSSVSSLMFPFFKYHSNVLPNTFKLGDRLAVERSDVSPLKGVEVLTRTRNLSKVDEKSFSADSVPLDKNTEQIIRSFIDYCKRENLRVLFVKYPTVLTESNPDELIINQRANRILEIADESGFDTLNMQSQFHKIGLIEEKDYYNHGHTNTRGQKKITQFLGSYIQEELDISPSTLSRSEKDSWNKSTEYYDAYFRLSEELITQGKHVTLGDSPKIVSLLDRILSGEDIKSVAEDCVSE